MATKLKNLKINKVDFVDSGANPKADIKFFKNKDGTGCAQEESVIDNPKFWKRFTSAIIKAFQTEDDAEPEAAQLEETEPTNFMTESKGETEMNIDKSKLTEAERAFLESIEKRYGTEGSPAAQAAPQTTPAASTTQAAENPVEKSAPKTAEVTPATQEADDIYKGLHPAVKAELETLKKFKEEAEERELGEVAKKYEIIGKKKEELVPLFKSLRAAGGTAYHDMIAVLDGAAAAVEKSAAFTEIGKSGSHGGTTEGAAWAKAETQAAEIMKSKNVTKAQALDEVFQNNPELAAECEKEE